MKKLTMLFLVVFMVVQYGAVAAEIDYATPEEFVTAEQVEQAVQETTDDLISDEEAPIDQTEFSAEEIIEDVTETAQQEELGSVNEKAEQDASDNATGIAEQKYADGLLDDSNKECNSSNESLFAESEEVIPNTLVVEESIGGTQDFISEATVNLEAAMESEAEQEPPLESQNIIAEVSAAEGSPKVLAESSGFTAMFIDLTNKKAYATLDKGMQKYIDLGDEYGSKWKSSNRKVATVSSEGLVTCKARGTTKITVTARPKRSKKKQKRTLILTVVDPLDPTGLGVHNDPNTSYSKSVCYSYGNTWYVVPGFKHQMEVDVVPEGSNKNVTWKTSNKKVVSITKGGYMTCIKPGKARITVKSDNGLTGWIDIVVQQNRIDQNVYNIDKGLSYAVEAGAVRIYLKSINVVNNNRVDATFYLCNGTNKKIKKIRNVNLILECGYENYNDFATYPFASKWVSKINVTCKAERWTTFKARFVGKEIKDLEWYLNNPSLWVEDEKCSCTY